ncbi:hypothetical protein NMY22_g8506 [Coprinellus aureogranulatus]|nr:hypothetical protein NMY22_g8506 [Coprinellus aureogranulatus]
MVDVKKNVQRDDGDSRDAERRCGSMFALTLIVSWHSLSPSFPLLPHILPPSHLLPPCRAQPYSQPHREGSRNRRNVWRKDGPPPRPPVQCLQETANQVAHSLTRNFAPQPVNLQNPALDLHYHQPWVRVPVRPSGTLDPDGHPPLTSLPLRPPTAGTRHHASTGVIFAPPPLMTRRIVTSDR